MHRVGLAASALATLLVVGSCTSESGPEAEPHPTSPAPGPTTPSPTASAGTTASSAPADEPRDPAFSARRAMGTVRFLAGDVGPRPAPGPAFRRAARWVADRFRSLGYDVSQQTFPVPAGNSWGVPVEAGTSVNVVATPAGFDARAPYVVIGAHLDTVAVAPGAEDNASGIAVLLETARRWSIAPGDTPVVFVSFGGEEPRGHGEGQHHFGSRHYVDLMTPAERRHLRGMVSLDRVGVGPPLTVGWVQGTAPAVRDALLRVADRAGVRTAIEENTGSDHESFADAGLPAARLGGTAYAAYHSADDVPAVVHPEQLSRTGDALWAWLIARAR